MRLSLVGAAWQHLFRLVWAAGPGRWREAAAALGAAVVSAAVMLGLQWPGLREEAQARDRQVRQLQDRLAQLDAQLRRLPPAPAERPSLPPGTEGTPAGRPHDPWHWHGLALAAGLQVEQLKPLATAATGLALLQLRLRGRYHQHGQFMAALASEPQAFGLQAYQLQPGAGGRHQAELVLALPLQGQAGLSHDAAARRYQPAPHLDPLAEDASLPAFQRAARSEPPGVFEGESLSTFTLVGTLQRDGLWLAFAQGLQGLHTLQVGDRIGPHRWEVRRIAEQGLWLREHTRGPGGRWTEQERLWRVGDKP